MLGNLDFYLNFQSKFKQMSPFSCYFPLPLPFCQYMILVLHFEYLSLMICLLSLLYFLPLLLKQQFIFKFIPMCNGMTRRPVYLNIYALCFEVLYQYTCYCVGMVYVTSASRYVTSASRYQNISPMYIRGLIPRNSKEFVEAVTIA